MRYLLTADPWDARTAYGMGVIQEIAIGIANRIAGCGPRGIQTTLLVAHFSLNDAAAAAGLGKFQAPYVSLFRSDDFMQGRKAEAEGRPPVFIGR
jgi:enoyl-CoA hydratase